MSVCFNRSLVVVAMTVAGVSVAGCAAEVPSEHAKVHGKVTYKGKPVPFGSVLFMPVEPPKEGKIMEPASGTIGPDGSYELTSQKPGDGAVLGEHKVIVYAVESGSTDADTKAASDSTAPAPAAVGTKSGMKNLLPKKYSAPDTTPLTRKVVAGDNTFDIEIVD